MKSVHIFGATAKLETTYNTSSSPAVADAILLAENPLLAVSYANDGARVPPSATMGHQKRISPTGRTGETTLKVEPRGAAAAYSASVTPNIHALLRAAGFDAAVTTTPGAEKWVYSPTPGPITFGSVSANLFGRGQQYTLTGVYGDFSMGADGPGQVPLIEIPIKGVLPTIADVGFPSLSALVALGAILPPKTAGIAFTFNAVSTLLVKSWKLSMGRTINPRLDQNAAGGHAGFGIGMRAPMLEFTVENEALATIDFYALRDAATSCAFTEAVGSVQYNKWNIACANCQVVGVTDADESPAATVTVTCQLNPSAFGSNDEIVWTFN